jgi:hypothetical protein
VFPTIAKFVGATLPKDRVLDGVDQSDFFMGETDTSGPGKFGDLYRQYALWRKMAKLENFAERNGLGYL